MQTNNDKVRHVEQIYHLRLNLHRIIQKEVASEVWYQDRGCEEKLVKCLENLEENLNEWIKSIISSALEEQIKDVMKIFAIQQFTGMHYSEGRNVYAVCQGMGLTAEEWNKIKEDCSWLTELEVKEIEDYLTSPTKEKA